jgi:hypothetical protein
MSLQPRHFDLQGYRLPLSSILFHQGPSVISPVGYTINRMDVAPVRRLICEIHCVLVSTNAPATIRIAGLSKLTAAVKVKFHEGNWRMDAEIVDCIVVMPAYPGKVCLVEVVLEQLRAVVENLVWVILVEGPEEADDFILLMQIEQ